MCDKGGRAVSREQATKLIYGELDSIRSAACAIAESLGSRNEAFDRWVSVASKRQLFAEMLFLLANNHKQDMEVPF